METDAAFKGFEERLKYIDSLSGDEKHVELSQGVLAGNVFDWGAKEILT